MQLFHFFDVFSAPRKAAIKATDKPEQGVAVLETNSWPQIDRRQGEDRRMQERRTMHCQPYIDTRKNNGRRRSLGRRVTDQATVLPF